MKRHAWHPMKQGNMGLSKGSCKDINTGNEGTKDFSRHGFSYMFSFL